MSASVRSRAIAWASRAWGRPVTHAETLTGGWTSDMLRLTAPDGSRSVLRLMVRDPWRRHAVGLLTRERDVQDQLSGTAVPAPRSIAVDPDGGDAGVPAHLMSWLPGRLELGRDDAAVIEGLARLLRAVHRHDPGAERPRDYQSWAHPAKRVVPPWATRPEVWRDAFRLLESEPPAHREVFLHRDFHLGNVLWQGDEPSGLVDWVETSWGPAALDVSHCATYLGMLHGLDAAHRFREAYGDTGETADSGRYWAVMDVVGYLPGPEKVLTPWRDAGHVVGLDLARGRLEGLLVDALGGWHRPAALSAQDPRASVPRAMLAP